VVCIGWVAFKTSGRKAGRPHQRWRSLEHMIVRDSDSTSNIENQPHHGLLPLSDRWGVCAWHGWMYYRERSFGVLQRNQAFVCTALRAFLHAHQLKVNIFVPRLSFKPLHYQTPFLYTLWGNGAWSLGLHCNEQIGRHTLLDTKPFARGTYHECHIFMCCVWWCAR
jgi:hypothetical protein